MRPVWKGAVSFGLVSIPVKLYTATESKTVRFNYLHKTCKTPIRYQKVCPVCDEKVDNDEIVRGYEYQKGRYVIINDEDLDNLPLESVGSVQILDFVDLMEIDPIYFMKSYFLAPGQFGEKPYYLLLQALKETGKIAVAKVFLRSKETLAALRVYQDCLLLETMFFPNEVRHPEVIPELQEVYKQKVHENELKMARTLIENLTAKFDSAKYSSNYLQALLQLIEKKIKNEDVEIPLRQEEQKVVDLMEALKASIKATQKKKKAGTGKRSKQVTS